MKLRAFLICLLCATLANAQTSIFTTGAVWKYSTGSDIGAAWKNTVYNDSSWSSGPSQLGYGDGDEATLVPSGPAGNYHPTCYFRRSFNVTNPETYAFFTMKVKRDDGIVVYLNGVEVFRDNIPAGTPTYSTFAAGAITNENTFITVILSPAAFINGTNVFAAEVHQLDVTSSDVSFDMQLTAGGTAPSITINRGPYLQLATPTSMYLRWKTNVYTDSKVNFGAVPGSLSQSAAELSATLEHVVQLTGLAPATKYYYSIGSAGITLQGDTNNYFITPPVAGTEKVTRIWATGDCGTGQIEQSNAMKAYQYVVGNNYTDVWLLLGDNAYQTGTENDYTTRFFQPYMAGKVMKQTVLFPSPGNHDYANNADSLENRNRPYYKAFTLPKAGEAGGVPSGTEMYYSYDYANIHFISLDSYGTESGKKIFDTTSAQITWLKQDLAANTQKWTIAYWHHPPYTMGSHNSNNESELVEIRDKVVRILDGYKVDLVLCGHSHNYERSKIMKGHYGVENTYSPALHNASTSSGLYDGSANSCPYVKSSMSQGNEGIIYVVSGSAGKLGTTQSSYPHNAMHYSNSSQSGSFCIEVNGNRLDAKWIGEDSTIQDKFTILKDVNNSTDVTINLGDTADLTASWKGVYSWDSVVSAAKTVSVAPALNTDYHVKDGNFNCVQDTFHVTVLPPVNISGVIVTEDGDSIPGVVVKLTGSTEDSVITGIDGLYNFEVHQRGDYTISAYKPVTIPTNSGVTSLDISIMRRHILGSTQITSFYKILAADCNNSGAITTTDILITRKVILNNTVTFPNNKLWRFVSGFSDQLDPLSYLENRSYLNISSSFTEQNFIGIKLGDVNDSWRPEDP